MSDETVSQITIPSSGPPVAVLGATRNWSLIIVLYPSGPCLELVECVEGHAALIVYSERLDNIALVAGKLKEENP